MFDPINNKIIISRDVIIDEASSWDWKNNNHSEISQNPQMVDMEGAIRKDSKEQTIIEDQNELEQQIRPQRNRGPTVKFSD